jgi:uncharacterized protein (TIGR02099 family)
VRRVLRVFWWCFAAVVVSLAVALSAARLLLPAMSEYREQIELIAQRLVHRPVEIGQLDAAWRGLSPVLRLKQVVIRDSRFPDGALVVEEVQVGLDVIESALHRKWFTAGLRLIGTRLAFSTDLTRVHPVSELAELLGWLSVQESIALERVQLDWVDPGLFSTPLRLSDVSLQLVNDGDRHQLLVEGGLSEPFGSSLKVAADLRGSPREPYRLHGRVYLKGEGLNLQLADRWRDASGVVAAGRADIELWAGLREGRLEWGSGSLALEQPRFVAASDDAQSFHAEQLVSAFRWQLADGGWQVELRDFAIQRDSRDVWPASEVRLMVETGERLRIRGRASRIVLQEVHPMLPLLPWMRADALVMVDRLQPNGQLHDSEFEFVYLDAAAPVFSLRARFENLQFAASENLPGVSGLSGSVEGNLQAGILHLDSRGALLRVPRLFAAPRAVSQLQGIVRWQRYADLFRIETDQLMVQSGPIESRVRMQLDWPYQQTSPWLDLQLTLNDLPLTAVGAQLPERLLSPKAFAWLQGAFRAGTASNARLVLQGRLDQLPFDGNEGRLEASFDFADAVLNFHPEWGRLDGLAGSALFVGRSMRVTGRTARIMDSAVQRVVAVIDDFTRPVLKIDGTVSGTAAGMLDYVSYSPLGKRFGGFIDQISVRGDAHLQLDLDLPLKAGLGALAVNGRVALKNNELDPAGFDLAFTRITGELAFDARGITAELLRAELLGQPVQVSIYPWEAERREGTVVDIEGPLDLVALARKQLPGLAPLLAGVAEWHALLLIPRQPPAGEPALEVELRSDLRGIAVDLPEPFRKRREQRRDTLIRWAPGHTYSRPLEVSYADSARAAVLLSPQTAGIQRAALRFGAEPAQLPAQDEIHLGGKLPLLDAADWLATLQSVAATRGSAAAPTLAPVAVQLAVKRADVFGYRLDNLSIHSDARAPWQFLLRGDQVRGLAGWSPAQATSPPALKLEFERLVLNRQPGEPGAARPQPLGRPQALPELDVSIADLRLGDNSMGKTRLVARRVDSGLRFETLEVDGAAVKFKGEGSWLQTDSVQSTHFSADVSGGQLDELARLFGDSGAVKGGKLSGHIELNWPGGPAGFNLETVEGDLQITALDGRLVDVEEGAGKLINLFSLNSLQRRLSLDFNDLIKEGFSFDRLEGHIVVMDGDAFTSDLIIKGSSAVIEISGRTGLVRKDYDQLVTVTPQLSASLPIAGALAGGPAVGAAVFIAEKLVGDEINRMNRVQYQVSGSWDAPVYRKLRKERRSSDADTEKKP